MSYVCTEWTFESRPFMYIQKNFFGKTIIEVCTPCLYASFGTLCAQIGQLFEAQFSLWSMFVKSTNRCYPREVTSISEFFWLLKDSLYREQLTNLDRKGDKRSVKILTTKFYKSLFINILLHMNGRLSKIRSVHTYVVPRTVYFDWICTTEITKLLKVGRSLKTNFFI